MLLFCPACSNMLTISKPASTSTSTSSTPSNRFECRTCPYQYTLTQPYFETKRFTRKKASEILGGEEALDRAEKVEVPCKDDGCGSRQAAVYQLQIRSADEPMTTFFTCTKCLRRWQEN